MNELFETVLILSLIGAVLGGILICIKPLTLKNFPAVWQYYVCISVLIFMVIPVYKFIPEQEARKIQYMIPSETQKSYSETSGDKKEVLKQPDVKTPIQDKIDKPSESKVNIWGILSAIWITGTVIYILTVIISYSVYILKRRKNSTCAENNDVFLRVKNQLKIRRNIRLRKLSDATSPMLMGVFFPVVYIPEKEIPEEMLEMVFIHELTHYKRKDIPVKWFALFVNAVHWFNPLAYMISSVLSEACEISCDMKVTKNMKDAEQKLYMKTILELVEK